MGRFRGRPAHEEVGFTLIELLVALVIGALVVSSLFRFLTGQGQFVEMQSAREEVQQNSRAALELISGELRTVPRGDALVAASSDEITFRSARLWGIVCGGSGSTLSVAFPIVDGANYTVNGGTGVIVNLGTAAGPIWSNAVAVSSNGISAASSSCDGAALPAGVEGRTLTLGGTPQNGATTPTVGNILYVYDQVSYRTGTSAGVPGRWIQRQIGSGANQPMAGPISEGDAGLRFQYFATGSSTPVATPITDAAVRASVSRITVTVQSVSRHSGDTVEQVKADTAVIPLRNRV